MGSDLEAEVKRVETKLERRTIQQLIEAMDASEEISECYRRIQNHLERLTVSLSDFLLYVVLSEHIAAERNYECSQTTQRARQGN